MFWKVGCNKLTSWYINRFLSTTRLSLCYNVRCKILKMVWKIVCNTLASWCINRFFYEWVATWLQRQCIIRENCGGSCFTNYTTYVALNYKTIFFTEGGSNTHRQTLDHIQLFTIRTNVSILLSSHSLWCEMGHWDTSD